MIDGTRYLDLTYQGSHYATGFTISYEASTNLTHWNPAIVSPVSLTALPAQMETVTVRLAAGDAQLFLRIKEQKP